MKMGRFFGVLFGILGMVLMIGTAVLSFGSLNAPTQVAQVPQAGLDCAREVMDLIGAGDLMAASQRMYGQPELGVSGAPESVEAQKLWDVFLGSLSYEFQGPCYITDTGFAQNVLITALDIPAITSQVETCARELLNERIAAATVMTELYDDSGEFRADLIEEVMTQALDMAVSQSAGMKSVEATLGLIHRDGTWWAIPDDALLRFLTGGF